MIIAAVSTFALVLAIGPHVTQAMQATTPATETVETDSSTLVATAKPITKERDLEPLSTVKTPPLDRDSLLTEVTPSTVQDTPVQSATRAEQTSENTSSAPARGEVLADPAPRIELAAPETVAESTQTPSAPPPGQPAEIPASEWPTYLAQASAALAAAETAQGRFVQTNADGSVTTGDFALRRPGRLRFDYDDPVPVLIVADGTTVAMQDTELETIDRIPLAATPLGLILSRELDVSGDVEVLGVRSAAGQIGIEVQDATGEMEGQLTLILDAADYALQGWIAVDGTLQTTWVSLRDVKTNVRISPRLFRLDEAEDEEDER